MSEYGIDDDEAYELLRRRSMRTRQTMEELCKDLARSSDGQERGEFVLRRKLAD
jgi:AmiR/NasT family two-component response regulator